MIFVSSIVVCSLFDSPGFIHVTFFVFRFMLNKFDSIFLYHVIKFKT